MEKIEIGYFPRHCKYISDLTLYNIHITMFDWYQHNLTCMVMTDDYCILCRSKDVERLESLDKEKLNKNLLNPHLDSYIEFDGLILTTPYGFYD